MENPIKEKQFRDSLLQWSEGRLREFPWRETDSPYEILIAETLLQQTLAAKVPPVYEEFLSHYSTPGQLAEGDPKSIATLLEPLGLQNRKASALVKTGQRLREIGRVPPSIEELSDLPFVGLYGANAVLCFGFGERRPIVDVNVIRIYNRVFGHDFEDDRDERAWEFAGEILPEEDFQRYNLALLDHGATVCLSSNPRCEECPVNSICEYYKGSSFE